MQDDGFSSIAQQETIPLDVHNNESATAFLDYLKAHHVLALDVAIISRVRYLQVWKIGQGYPVTEAHAARVRAGLQQLTGIPYRATIAVLSGPLRYGKKRRSHHHG
jgi:hypothetical protein